MTKAVVVRVKKTIIITVGNNKGGVTKTFSTMQIASILANMGFKVLVIDIDPQGNLSKNFGLKDLQDNSIAEVILGKVEIQDAIKSTVTNDSEKSTYRENLDLISADLRLMEAEDTIKLDNRRNDNRLQKALKPIKESNEYDFIIMDNSPNASTLFVNSLTASDYVFIPIEADANSLEGFGLITKKINEVKEDSNPNLDILGICITKFEHTNLHKEYVDEVKEAFNGLVFDTIIPKAVVAGESIFERQALIEYRKSHKLTKAYEELTDEIINRIEK